MDSLTQAVILADPEGQVLAVNQAALEMLGYERAEVLGRPVGDFVAHAALARGQGLGRVLRDDVHHQWEAEFLTKSGGRVPVALHITGLSEAAPTQTVVILATDLRPRRELQELRVLHAVARAAAEATDEDRLIEQVTAIIGEALYPDNFGILLFDEASGILRIHPSYRGIEPAAREQSFPLGQGITGTVAQTGRPLRVADVSQDPRYVEVDPGMRSELCVPIRLGERILGVINTESTLPDAFTEADERLLSTVAGLLATAIEQVRLFRAEREQHRLAEALRDASAALSEVLDFDVVLDRLLDQIARVVPYDAACVMLLEGERAVVTRTRGYERFGPEVAEDTANLTLNLNSTPNLKRMAATGLPMVIPDTRLEPGWVPTRASEHCFSWAGAPILAHGKALGFLSLDKVEPGFYDESHADLLKAFVGAAGLALQNARLFEDSVRQTRELSGLYQTLLATSTVLDTETLLHRLYEQVAQLLAPDTFVVVLYDAKEDTLEVALAIEEGRVVPEAVPAIRLPLAEGGLTGWVMRHRHPLLVRDMVQDPLPAEPRHGARPARSWLGVPLVARERLLGALSVQSFRPGAFDEADQRFLEAAASQVAIALENAQLYEAARRQAEELRTLFRVSSALRAASGTEEMLPILLREACEAVAATSAVVFLADEDSGEYVLRAWHPPDLGPVGNRHKPGEGMTGYVAETGEVVIVDDVHSDPRARFLPAEHEVLKEARSSISLPLRAEDQTVGVLHVHMAEPAAFTPDKARLLTAVAEIAGNALQRARVLETLEQRVRARTRELEEANERLRELDRLKSDFVSNVSHELRTPITNILLYLDLLEQMDDESRRRRYISVLRRESARLARLIEDLLTLSRIEQDRAPLYLEHYQADTLLAEVVTAHEARARRKEIRLRHLANPDLPEVLMDREQMVQVLANLLSNALAYTPPGGLVEVSSEVRHVDGQGYIAMKVYNEGPTIPEEDLPHLFDRFYRGRTGRESGEPGTGLGLAICKEIVDRHGGHIEVRSEEGEGTVFAVLLPIDRSESP